MNDIPFAIVGCGRIASKHAALLSGAVPGARLAAVCDLMPDRARAFGEKHLVPWFTDYREMLGRHPEVEAVNILTESGSHAAIAMDVASLGRHVVVEKPLALRLEDADRLIEACDRAGVKLFVVKQNRYNLPVVKLKEALVRGRFGKIVMGTVRVRWCRRQEYYDHDAWRGTWAMDGGVFTNQASHHIDLLEWMLGEPVSVFARSRTALANIETEDTGVAVISFASGALGVVEATTATRPADLEGSISILGENGTVEISGFAVNEIRTWSFFPALPEDEEIRTCYNQNPPDVYGFGHLSFLRNVVESLRNNAPALVDGLEGRKSLALINAIYESIETGQEIALAFRPRLCRLGVRG